ncbi:MAG: response regulator [Hahellaceae bacterium]|nr:response regulator [Hahellaceae bacterium]MCP5169254.1 response regulator [Hahellaceae bacterium]
MTKVLIIDDEPQIRRFIRISLTSQGYELLEEETGQGGLQTCAMQQPDVVILDLGLPDMDGQQVLSRLREFYHGVVIVLSVRNREAEKVRALDAGANDYVVKPFGVKELLARIRALLKLRANAAPGVAIFDDGNLRIDLAQRRVLLGNQEARLSKKEFDLLRMLMNHPGRIVTQQHLLRELWGPSHIEDTHYLRIFIGKLRTKLGDDPAQPTYIETEPGVGYRFLGQEDTSPV